MMSWYGWQNAGWPFASFILAVVIIWATFWKGLALWKAARHEQKYWFIALLVVNTAGLLEIIYLAFSKRRARNINNTPADIIIAC